MSPRNVIKALLQGAAWRSVRISRPAGRGVGARMIAAVCRPSALIAALAVGLIGPPALRDEVIRPVATPSDLPVRRLAMGGGRTVIAHLFFGGGLAILDLDLDRWRFAEEPWRQVSRMAPGHGGEHVFMGTEDGRIAVLDAATLVERAGWRAHDSRVQGIGAVDGLVVSADFHGRVRAWEATTGRLIWEADTGPGVLGLEASEAAGLVATFHVGGRIAALDAATGVQRLSWRRPCGGTGKSVRAIAFAPDGGRIALIDAFGRLLLLRLGDGDVRVVDLGGAQASDLAFAADGQSLVVGTADGLVLFLALEAGRVVGRRRIGRVAVTAVTFAGDGRHVVAACGGTAVLIERPGEDGVVRAQRNVVPDRSTRSRRVVGRSEK